MNDPNQTVTQPSPTVPVNICFISVQCSPPGNIQRNSAGNYNLFLPLTDTLVEVVASINMVQSLRGTTISNTTNLKELQGFINRGVVGNISGLNQSQQVITATDVKVRQEFGRIQPFSWGPIPYQSYLVVTLVPGSGETLPIGPYGRVYLNLVGCTNR